MVTISLLSASSFLFSLAPLAAPVGPTFAGTGAQVCVGDEIALATTNWNGTFEFPQFDPSQGFLQSVHVTFAGHVEGSAGVESLDASAIVVTIDYGANITLRKPGGGDLLTVSPSAQFIHNLTPFDGTIDFGGTSGVSHPDISLDDMGRALAPPDALDLNDFIGLGTVSMGVGASGVSQSSGSGNLINQFATSASASIEVCYNFVPDCNDNGIPDDRDIGGKGGSSDCDRNGVPDECDSDCDRDGLPDACEVDGNSNGIPDDCESPDVDLGCSEWDRYEDLTPNDTFSVITRQHNAQHAQGFALVVATDGNDEIGFDYLIGQSMVINGFDALEYAINAVDYRAAVGHGDLTDLDNDGVRDLNGEEYELTAAEILIPRFIGVNAGSFIGEQLILIGLSGGTRFNTTVDFLIYNDNEEVFSTEFNFDCWAKVPLLGITNTFSNEFLANGTQDDPLEALGANETGWFRMRGASASSTAFQIPDPAIYAVYIEKYGAIGAADLPFERGVQAGHLLPRAVGGDNGEANGTDPARNLGANIARRHPASLLMFPEFDNRTGDVTLFSITNTHLYESVTAHFVYYGKYGSQN